MPQSKRRKTKQSTGGMPRQMASAHFRQLAHMDGEKFTVSPATVYGYDLDTVFADAWHTATTDGYDYAEGVAWSEAKGAWVAHAWVVRDGVAHDIERPEMGVLSGHRGWVLDPREAELILSGELPQTAIIEQGLRVSGANYADLATRLRKTPTTSTTGPQGA